MSVDDLIEQMQQDELEDGLEVAKENPELVKLTPINYAKARGIRPQTVYKAIRDKRLEKQTCACGRHIVDVEAADALFGFDKKPGDLYAEEVTDDTVET